MSTAQWRSVVDHVLPEGSLLESAAFLFSRTTCGDVSRTLTVVDIIFTDEHDLLHQSSNYLELTDKARIQLQKTALALKATIIEVHGHPLQSVAEFSPADLLGFEESVPALRWRLENQPYGAIVMASDSFDALVWWNSNIPATIDAVCLEKTELKPSGLTMSLRDGRRPAV